MNEQDLKECPYCGHEAELRENERSTVLGDPMRTFYVICGNLHCGIRTLECISPNSAVRIWNRRTQL
jgi:hypothetical protein